MRHRPLKNIPFPISSNPKKYNPIRKTMRSLVLADTCTSAKMLKVKDFEIKEAL